MTKTAKAMIVLAVVLMTVSVAGKAFAYPMGDYSQRSEGFDTKFTDMMIENEADGVWHVAHWDVVSFVRYNDTDGVAINMGEITVNDLTFYWYIWDGQLVIGGGPLKGVYSWLNFNGEEYSVTLKEADGGLLRFYRS